eukprot:TRINITY_DN10193_c0_g1_i4.p4 TRINITY_DN10193_c0_g1~~TRINITY_DN10193_c0_g1_i4.p4  ORF type:complete len:121 (+),score=10.22 TRINITY_DN10193_c0_g1_i4:437-799(+)
MVVKYDEGGPNVYPQSNPVVACQLLLDWVVVVFEEEGVLFFPVSTRKFCNLILYTFIIILNKKGDARVVVQQQVFVLQLLCLFFFFSFRFLIMSTTVRLFACICDHFCVLCVGLNSYNNF